MYVWYERKITRGWKERKSKLELSYLVCSRGREQGKELSPRLDRLLPCFVIGAGCCSTCNFTGSQPKLIRECEAELMIYFILIQSNWIDIKLKGCIDHRLSYSNAREAEILEIYWAIYWSLQISYIDAKSQIWKWLQLKFAMNVEQCIIELPLT